MENFNRLSPEYKLQILEMAVTLTHGALRTRNVNPTSSHGIDVEVAARAEKLAAMYHGNFLAGPDDGDDDEEEAYKA